MRTVTVAPRSRSISGLIPSLILLAAVASLAAAPAVPPARSVAELRQQLAAHLAAPHLKTAQIGLKVVSLDSGDIFFAHDSGQYFSPASNSKLFTTALALARLGPDYRLKTSLYAAARPDASGRLAGDLIVFGRGDPTLSPRLRGGNAETSFQPFIRILQAAGVKSIAGGLAADESFFRGPPHGSGWSVDDLESASGAELSALSFHDNTIALTVRPGDQAGGPARLSLAVPTSTINVNNRVATVRKGASSAVEIHRRPGDDTAFVSGTIALDATYAAEIPVRRPARLFAEQFREALARQGIAVDGPTRIIDWIDREIAPLNPASLVELGVVESMPLREILGEILKPSQNLYTDLLLAHVGELSRTAASAGRTSEELGIAALNSFLPRAGIGKSDVVFEEGSGLSRNNLVTPDAIVSLLQFMNKRPDRAVYFDALPVAGVDGTLRTRFRNTPAQGNVRAKTGTLRWASSLSGSLTNAAGEHLAFSVLVNRYNNLEPNPPARAEIEDLVLLLVRSTCKSEPHP